MPLDRLDGAARQQRSKAERQTRARPDLRASEMDEQRQSHAASLERSGQRVPAIGDPGPIGVRPAWRCADPRIGQGHAKPIAAAIERHDHAFCDGSRALKHSSRGTVLEFRTCLPGSHPHAVQHCADGCAVDQVGRERGVETQIGASITIASSASMPMRAFALMLRHVACDPPVPQVKHAKGAHWRAAT